MKYEQLTRKVIDSIIEKFVKLNIERPRNIKPILKKISTKKTNV